MMAGRIFAVILAASLASISVASLHAQSDATLPPGDAARGKSIFEGSKGNCLSCHRVQGAGSLYAPDLSVIGSPARGAGGAAPAAAANARGGAIPAAPAAAAAGGPTPQQLAQSILDPNAVVAPQNRYVRLTMRDGKTIWGKLLSVDTFAVQIFDSNQKLANITKADVRDMTMASPMPSYRDKLSSQELADVVAYLSSLKAQ